jgi:hypothetical protein
LLSFLGSTIWRQLPLVRLLWLLVALDSLSEKCCILILVIEGSRDVRLMALSGACLISARPLLIHSVYRVLMLLLMRVIGIVRASIGWRSHLVGPCRPTMSRLLLLHHLSWWGVVKLLPALVTGLSMLSFHLFVFLKDRHFVSFTFDSWELLWETGHWLGREERMRYSFLSCDTTLGVQR